MVWCIPGQPVLKNMVLKLSGTQRQGVPKRGGSPPPRGRTTSLYRSGYYRSGVVQDDMAVPPATYLGHGAGGGGGTAASSASSTPAWERPPNGGQGEAAVREWVAQVEPGVQITFVSLAGGAGNDLKRIRFSREMYYKWQAQRWCGDNNERIMELYNVRRFTHQVLPDPPRDDDAAEQRESFYSQSQVGSTMGSPPQRPAPAQAGPAARRGSTASAARCPRRRRRRPTRRSAPGSSSSSNTRSALSRTSRSRRGRPPRPCRTTCPSATPASWR
ncbi:protein Brevis radix-like 4 isoform X1 [Triticum aestivum]|uniref:protein Brevis radix-like 4 isoform X1 n=1 Tax=Triticum aestivum TaxID=4565 RepID=UPI001D01714B|nr:protein Brevis radix-like 4 isoform X1 [Triticum aestivum]